MVIVSISDTHGAKFHSKLKIPKCDVLIHSGDIGGRTNAFELTEFLIWFNNQPAKKKIFIAGNHELCLDYNWVKKQEDKNSILGLLAKQEYEDSIEILKKFDIEYLLNSEVIYDGIKFWGSPYSPSFHREHWAFNADPGDEISQYWNMIPKDADVIITHTPVRGIHDKILEGQHKGCLDLNLKVKEIEPALFLCGHIHEGYGFETNGKTTYVNSSVLNRDYCLKNKPILIDLNIKTKETKIL